MELIFTNNSDKAVSFILYENNILELNAKESKTLVMTEEEFLEFVNYHKPTIITQEIPTPTTIKEWVAGIDSFNINNDITISLIEEEPPVEKDEPYMLFEEEDSKPFTAYLGYIGEKIWEGKIEYSKDNINWVEYDPSSESDTNYNMYSSDDGKLYLRGLGNTRIYDDSFTNAVSPDSMGFNFYAGNTVEYNPDAEKVKIKVSGNIENLLDYQMVQEGKHPQLSDYAFFGLFEESTYSQHIYTDLSQIKLPTLELSIGCYKGMFWNVSNTSKFPTQLPATNLKAYCYDGMFQNCVLLDTAPSLESTILSDYCYRNMFYGCTSLVNVQTEIPATTFGPFCCAYMFNGCKALVTAPDLSKMEKIDKYSFQGMFNACSSLVDIPLDLPAMELKPGCYSKMFSYCTSLTKAPKLPATKLDNYCYEYMFQGCSSLIDVQDFPIISEYIGKYHYLDMFEHCTALKVAPKLPTKQVAESCYVGMFSYCTSLVQAPELPATELSSDCYRSMFSNCTSLIVIPSLPAENLVQTCYQYMFRGCTSIKLSETQTDEYQIPYRIPYEGDGVTAEKASDQMFTNTGGTFKQTPTINTTYYLSTENSIV